jgi:hypothetical protein
MSQVYMEGWLTKITTEQRRWFVLTADTFAYYKDEVIPVVLFYYVFVDLTLSLSLVS